VGRIEKDHAYWCGNGYRITSNGIPGFYHKVWSQTPWCISGVSNATGWDAPHNQWAHSEITGSIGLYTPWGFCATYSTSHAQLRIAANGYWDAYYDF
jgi:hypothetical protein